MAETESNARQQRRGRPRKPEEERRTERVTVRLSPKELNAAQAKADRAGHALSTYLREAGLGKQLASLERRADRAETIRQLSRIGNNLNQLARQANSQEGIDGDQLAEALGAFERAVSRI